MGSCAPVRRSIRNFTAVPVVGSIRNPCCQKNQCYEKTWGSNKRPCRRSSGSENKTGLNYPTLPLVSNGVMYVVKDSKLMAVPLEGK
jgi:hypothetical protein